MFVVIVKRVVTHKAIAGASYIGKGEVASSRYVWMLKSKLRDNDTRTRTETDISLFC